MTDNNNSATTTLPGALTIGNVSEAKQQIDSALAGSGAVVIDAGLLKTVDTAGVQLLVALGKHCRNAGTPLTVNGLQGDVVSFAEGMGISVEMLTGQA